VKEFYVFMRGLLWQIHQRTGEKDMFLKNAKNGLNKGFSAI
jgi:hypothetical protein